MVEMHCNQKHREENTMTKHKRVVMVSNRLPIFLTKNNFEHWNVKSGSGGLVTALAPILRNRGGAWIGWLGIAKENLPPAYELDKILAQHERSTGFNLIPVNLTHDEIDKYYHGFANEILWPLFHDLFPKHHFDPIFYDAYQSANQKFAEVIVNNTDKDDYIWIHDYHLIFVAQKIKEMGAKRDIGFFLHTPFPSYDIFTKLPWRFKILDALLKYDLIGFQTIHDRRNFIGCVRVLHGCKTSGRGSVSEIVTQKYETRVGSFPISIDFNDFQNKAMQKDVAEQAWIIHEHFPDNQLLLGIDRLDYTKGIPNRLLAFKNALDRYPNLRGKITLIQVVVPSRTSVDEYEALKNEIEQLIGEVNGKYTDVGWVPIHYIFRSLSQTELLAYYRTCEIALITPLKDGMNLVAKEFCACSLEENSVLILSEFAGAASQMYKHALIVNPYDIENIADAIHQAYTMPYEEREKRMKLLRKSIHKNDIFLWVNNFLKASIAENLDGFPQEVFFVPEE